MHEVIPRRLWIGHAMDAADVRALGESGIAAVVDLAYEVAPPELPRELIYCRYPIVDGTGNDRQLLWLAVKTVVEMLRSGTPTLVTCGAGMSRSPIIVAAALSLFREEPPDVSLQSVVRSRPHDVSPTLWHEVCEALER